MSSVITNFDAKKALFRQLAKAKAPEGGGASDENAATGNAAQEQAIAPQFKSPSQQAAVGAGADSNKTDASTTAKTTAPAAAAAGVKTVAKLFDPFNDENGTCFIYHEGDAIRLESTRGSDLIRMAALAASDRTISEDNLKMVRTVLRQGALARDVRPVYRRIGKVIAADGAKAYVLDRGDRDRGCLHVDAHGVQPVTAESLGVAFQRGPGYAELPEPIMPADARGAWAAIQPLLQGLPARDHLPLIAAKVEHLRCDSPHPILVFLGPAGSGKTTVARHCLASIDPFRGEPPSVATDVGAITSAAQARHSLLIDNVGTALGGDIENTLCRTALGAATTVRELFTTADPRTLTQFAAVHLTGITAFLRQSDTLDRALVMRVSRPAAGFKPGAEVQAEFDAQHPCVLGGLLYFLAERMKAAPFIEKQQTIRHRMVDWAVTGEAIAQSLSMAPGDFIAQQTDARATAARDWIEGDRFAAPLVAWVQSMRKGAPVVAALPPKTALMKDLPWVGIVAGRTVVVAAARHICDGVQSVSLAGGPQPPTTARQTSGALDRVQTGLAKAGWRIESREWNGGRNTYWLLVAPP